MWMSTNARSSVATDNGLRSEREDTEIPGLVSVVLNFFNAEEFMDEAIASVYAQSYPNWELLLVDDGSADGSTGLAKSYAVHDPSRVRYVQHPGHENRGASAARNLGIASARGELIAFLDADDVWLPNRLEGGVEVLRLHPDADLVYGETEYWCSWESGREPCSDRVQRHGFRADRVVPPPELLIRYLTHRAAVPCPTSMTLRRRVARDIGGFIESFRGLHDDQAFLARFCLHHGVYVANKCWDRYRQHDASLCASAQRLGDVARAREVYLAWLQDLFQKQQLTDARLWSALRYAESVHRYEQPGLWARLARTALSGLMAVQSARWFGHPPRT
jgi:glycosyltransferase involved in cell wall biosynthesis